MFQAEATYLDLCGCLYGGVQHPYWLFGYFKTDPDTLILIVVHPDGSTTVTDYASYYEEEIDFTFTSADVQTWLALARDCYRYLTGREDDVCYGLAAHCLESDSTAFVTLYDENYVGLALVTIDLEDGTVGHIELL